MTNLTRLIINVLLLKISFNVINFLTVLAASAVTALIVGFIKTIIPDLILCVAAGIIIYAALSLALKTVSGKDIADIRGVLAKKIRPNLYYAGIR